MAAEMNILIKSYNQGVAFHWILKTKVIFENIC